MAAFKQYLVQSQSMLAMFSPKIKRHITAAYESVSYAAVEIRICLNETVRLKFIYLVKVWFCKNETLHKKKFFCEIYHLFSEKNYIPKSLLKIVVHFETCTFGIHPGYTGSVNCETSMTLNKTFVFFRSPAPRPLWPLLLTVCLVDLKDQYCILRR